MISVIIPTYKRLAFLKRAVEDVFNQSYTDWELIVSDDEIAPGETWAWLQNLAKRNKRVRVLKNIGPKHGQVHNVNNALRQCQGEWIKVLYDDDRMVSCCLEKMHAVSEKYSGLAMIGCRAQQWRCGKYTGDEKDFSVGRVDIIKRADCRYALCRFDRWNGRTPTHMMINRKAVEAGAFMPNSDKYIMPVDVAWFASILDHGDYAMMRDVLVHQREGEVASLTACTRSDECMLDRELFSAYKDVYDGMSENMKRKLSWRDVEGQINGIRGIYHLKCCHIFVGLKMFCKMFCTVRAPLLTIRWLLQESFRRHFCATSRIVCR